MVKKITRASVCGKSTDAIHGAWLKDGEHADAHVYDQADVLVIGHNKDYRGMNFSAQALVMGKDGICTLQYEGAKGQKGNPIIKKVSADVVRDAIKKMLAELQATVSGK